MNALSLSTRELLFDQWHPLQVGDNKNVIDEYDQYIPRFIEIMENGGSSGELEVALLNVEMALRANIGLEKRQIISRKMMELFNIHRK